ncbi:GuaB1 family IMP dehydrogenase-related protein, partial [Rhodococcus hoagii]|nr:GuaB1 family IMP dehydrogenase-related protein [Prescottella equi]
MLTESSCADVDRFTRVGAVAVRDFATAPVTATPRECSAARVATRSTRCDRRDDGMLAGVLTRTGAIRAGSTPPPSTSGPAADRGGRRGQRGLAATRRRPARRRRRPAGARHPRTATSNEARALRAVAALGLGVPLVAGNVVSARGTRDLIDDGSEHRQVGVGPGAMCTTRMMTASAGPSSPPSPSARPRRATGRARVGGRGVRHPRDVALALA